VALENDMPKYTALFFASFGNILAIIVNYFFGFWLYEKTKARLNSSRTGKKSLKIGEKYGYFALFFSWLPVIGDPLTLVAGVLRLNFLIFILLAGLMRISRYYILTFVL
jgi:membrane protein YqaA with SNARE-associated domain